MQRKGTLAFAAALAGACALAVGSHGARAQGGPIIVANWGGITNEAYDEAYVAPFTEETGIEVQQVAAPGLFVARAQAQAQAGRVEWDVLESLTDSDVAFLADAGLLEPLPADLKSRLVERLGEENVSDYGYHSGMTAMLIICNTERVEVCPKTMAEFWDTEAFPQRRAIIGFNPIYPITAAQLAMGVSRDEAVNTPIDVDAVFAKLEEIRPHSVIWSSVDQGTQVLEQGEADMGILYATRIYSELLPTGNYDVVWADGVRAQGTTVVLKGAPNMEAAWNLLEWNASHLEEQAQFALIAQKAPIDADALELLEEDMRERYVNAPMHKGQLAIPNAIDLNAKFDEINRRWQEFVSG